MGFYCIYGMSPCNASNEKTKHLHSFIENLTVNINHMGEIISIIFVENFTVWISELFNL